MFRRARPESAPSPSSQDSVIAVVPSPTEMALDTVGAILRIMGDSALDQENMDAATFSSLAERWAQHVLVAAPAPAATVVSGTTEGRRHWAGIRDFVSDYCRGASTHARTVTSDLRQVVWVFIQSLSHAFSEGQDSDTRIRDQLSRLEALVSGAAPTADLKKEVLSVVVGLSQTMDERRRRHREQMDVLGAQVRSLGTELESARREGETDPLTRLFNRKALDEYLDRSIELYRAFGHETSLLLIDVDRFKTINDGFGHVAGDEVLCKVADSIMRVFLRKNDFVARFGGDELAVVLRETKAADTVTLAERLLRAVRAIEVDREGTRLPVTTSIGIASLGPGDTRQSWVEAADKALYRAKEAGRDRAVSLQANS